MREKKKNKWDGCSLDRSFCSSKCDNMDCYRNSKYIKDGYPHSFMDFKGTEECILECSSEKVLKRKEDDYNKDVNLLKELEAKIREEKEEIKRIKDSIRRL